MKKTIIITGSTDGIGKLAAIQLAKEGHEIYLHGRNQTKLATVIEEVKNASNNANIKGFVADFSDLNAVKQMAEQILKEISKIDILINNAGIFKSPSPLTKDKLDIRFAVNYFAPYILTTHLLPLLNKSTEPRVINLSSAAQAPVSSEALSGTTPLASVNEAYAQSKLALTMWSFNLAKQQPHLTVITVNPGSLLNTRMANEAYGTHWSSADKGSNILYNLALSEEYKGITGKYFDNDKGDIQGSFGPAHSDAYNEILIEKLLQTTTDVLKRMNLT
ncbi:3-hydroxybutyrate dehydrogenase [Flavobacteriaceae bacterium UJ101]|nr:3-hydroxybutyrate dehydrogenase [Flavobacteriaceae bacterium UJ101]